MRKNDTKTQIIVALFSLLAAWFLIIQPVFGRILATCETKNLKSVELRGVSVAEIFGSHTDYYIRFENGDVVKVYAPRTVAEYMDGKTYQVKTCEGYESAVVE